MFNVFNCVIVYLHKRASASIYNQGIPFLLQFARYFVVIILLPFCQC
jgi:hypothetical protein